MFWALVKAISRPFIQFSLSILFVLVEPWRMHEKRRFTEDEISGIKLKIEQLRNRNFDRGSHQTFWAMQVTQLENSAEILVNRRYDVHKFFTASQAAILAGIFVLLAKLNSTAQDMIIVIAGSAAGIVLSLIWHRSVEHLIEGVKRKMLLLEALQAQMPLPTFALELDAAPEILSGSRKIEPLSGSERLLPTVFAYFFLTIIILCTLSLYCLPKLVFEAHESMIIKVVRAANSNSSISKTSQTKGQRGAEGKKCSGEK